MPAAFEPIASLWIGERLTDMERLSICSFLAAGHPYHLYVYGDVQRVPEGTTLLPGDEILPASRLFAYKSGPGKGSYSAVSNLFRYRLLYETGKWWADTDMVCLRPFDFSEPYVLGAQDAAGRREDWVAAGVVKMPAGCHWAAELVRRCEAAGTSFGWGTCGPRLLTATVESRAARHWVQPPDVFYPVRFRDWRTLFEADGPALDDEATRGVHLWHEMTRREGLDPDGTFPETSVYQRLRTRFLS